MTGLPLIFVFILAIVLMIILISKLHIHPFVSIMCISLLLGVIAGIPLVNRVEPDGSVTQGLANVIGAGFSGTFSSIGIVIILGALIGSVLEATGAALKLADMVISLVGKNNPVLAMELMGWVVSIPVFCDSGFVILNPIRSALVRRTGASSVAMSVGLGSGLYLSHVFIPPTPGPIAAANILGIGDNLLMVMGLGALCSILPLAAAFFFSRFIGGKVKADDEADNGEVVKTYEELVAAYGKLPGGWDAVAPILVPILLMALSSICAMIPRSNSLSADSIVPGILFSQNFFDFIAGLVQDHLVREFMVMLGSDLIAFLGTPIIALAVGTVFAVVQLRNAGKMKDFYDLTNETLKTVGPILFVTAAGGVLGKVISSSDMVNYISSHATALSAMGIFFPFLLSAILKSAQGSSTVALTTTAGIVAPLLPVLGLDSPVRAALCCMAIGAGAMTVSHANDSFFWVVTNFGAMTPERGYKTWTLNTLVLGVAAVVEIFVLSLFLR